MTATLTPVRKPGSRPRVAPAGGSRKQKIPKILGEDANRLILRKTPQPRASIDGEMQFDLGAPGPAGGVEEPSVAGASAIRDRKRRAIRPLVADGARLRLGRHLEIEHLLLLATEHRQNPM